MFGFRRAPQQIGQRRAPLLLTARSGQATHLLERRIDLCDSQRRLGCRAYLLETCPAHTGTPLQQAAGEVRHHGRDLVGLRGLKRACESGTLGQTRWGSGDLLGDPDQITEQHATIVEQADDILGR